MAETLKSDQPLTPAGRLFLQPKMEQVIQAAIAVESPIDVDAIKSEVRRSVMLQHPRFCSLMVRDQSGRENWRRTPVDVDRHVIVRHEPISSDPDEDAVADFMADLSVSSPLPADKPLWEIHLLLAHKTVVFRVHHALGDGISLMSMLLSCCRREDDPERTPTIAGIGGSAGGRRWSAWALVKAVWFTLIYCLEFGLRALWLRDRTTALSGGDGVELWPRRLASARFRLDDMKAVKQAVGGATINDVLFGVISRGLSRYLDINSPKALPEGLRITGVAMVNLRSQAGLQDLSKLMDSKSGIRWGNKFGMLLLPIYYHRGGSDPIQFVRRAKAMIDKKKLSLEAPFSYRVGDLVMSLFGAKIACILNYRIVCNTTFTISNVIGPQEKITMVGNPVKHIRVTSSSLPHAITMHMELENLSSDDLIGAIINFALLKVAEDDAKAKGWVVGYVPPGEDEVLHEDEDVVLITKGNVLSTVERKENEVFQRLGESLLKHLEDEDRAEAETERPSTSAVAEASSSEIDKEISEKTL
ncbi:O-acyltransferase (WSD1-like) family protein [Striga hermonthica]|uniref:O-acyltransferase (WSD1-like) family protein n=1 Tax=Striga hermonthica TaxID=68872 RepID=A0A9N7NBE4_STRHE|nr:O-acyltransferase (WSD1-like) family protein [Striga hermonthica]